MANERHSFIAFYVTDWKVGTARMPRLHRSILFDVCCYIWERAERCPAAVLPTLIGDVPEWPRIIDELVDAGELSSHSDATISNDRALSEAMIALEKYQRASHRFDLRLSIFSTEWKELRELVFRRDSYTCRYCGKLGGALECDHVIPVVLGGSNDPSNLATACRPCNRSKGAKLLQEWVQ